MTDIRNEANRSATTTGTLLGVAIAAVVLLIVAALLTREPGSALKSVVAVWLAAVPVLGFGALCGRLLATVLRAATRARALRKQGC